MTDDTFPPPDDASDLFGYPPRPSVVCPGCGRRAEPFQAAFCFLCSNDGTALRMTQTTRHRQDRRLVLGIEE